MIYSVQLLMKHSVKRGGLVEDHFNKMIPFTTATKGWIKEAIDGSLPTKNNKFPLQLVERTSNVIMSIPSRLP